MEINVSPLDKRKKDSHWKYEIRIGYQVFSGTRPTEKEAREAAKDDAKIAGMFYHQSAREFDPTQQEG